jgi:methylmalonyl-CoA carboxyltransferase 5S subunit
MFPKVAPAFFGTRANGPINVGRDPGSQPQPEPGGQLAQPVAGPVRYSITLNGTRHSVQVEPA